MNSFAPSMAGGMLQSGLRPAHAILFAVGLMFVRGAYIISLGLTTYGDPGVFRADREKLFTGLDRLILVKVIKKDLKAGRRSAHAWSTTINPTTHEDPPRIFGRPTSTMFDIENTGAKAFEVCLGRYRHVELNIKVISVYPEMHV
jgi:hypothetical protein